MGMSRRFRIFIACAATIAFLLSSPAVASAQTDFTSKIQINKSLLSYDRRTLTSYLDISLANKSQDTAYMPIRAVVQSISSADVRIANADGLTDDGKPYFDYSSPAGTDKALSPGETSAKKRWIFSNPKGLRFTYSVIVSAEESEDTAPPDILIANPVNGSIISNSNPYITVGFRDDKSGVDLSRLVIVIDGTDETDNFGCTSSCALYRLANSLEEGDHQIVVSLSDMRGNVNIVISRFSVQDSTGIDRYIFSLPLSPWIFSSPGDGTCREYLSPEEIGISEDRDVISLSMPSRDGGVYFSTPDHEGIQQSIGSGVFNPFFNNEQLGLNISDRISALDMGLAGDPVIIGVLGQSGIYQSLGLGSREAFFTNEQLGLSPDARIDAVQRNYDSALYFHIEGQRGIYEHSGSRNALFLTEDDLGVPGSVLDAFALLPEQNAPAVAIVNPAEGSSLNTSFPDITLIFHDDESGIDPSSFQVKLDGADVTNSFTLSGTGASWQVSQATPLPDGSHVLTATIADRAGNQASAASQFSISTAFPPTVNISADPISIMAGGSATLSWSSSHAETLSIDNGIGMVDPSGAIAVSPSATTTYTAVATGPGGTVTDSVTVIVYQAPSVAITAQPSTVAIGESAVLSWTSVDADTVTIDNGIGEVDLNGTISVAPNCTTTYTITASGPGGTAEHSITVIVGLLPAVTLSASPNPIVAGSSSTLTWTSSNATSVNIDQGIGNVGLSGSIAVSPSITTTYTITASGQDGTSTASCTLDVTPKLITINYPTKGANISRPDVMVMGTIHDTVSQDRTVTVNGLPAFVYGSIFLANHVPLQEGINTIRASVKDSQGHFGETSITVGAVTTGPYISLLSSHESGFSPLNTTIKIITPPSKFKPMLNVNGPGSVVYLSGSTSYEYISKITGPGIYYLTARLIYTPQTLSDVMGIVVFDQEDADALIREKWNGMKTLLLNRDIDGALGCFCLPSSNEYREIFTLLGDELPVIAAGMEDIEKVYIEDDVAKYRIRKNEEINGAQYRITSYIYFANDAYGNWYIDSF